MAKGSSINKAKQDLDEQIKLLAASEPKKALTILESATNAARNANRKYRIRQLE